MKIPVSSKLLALVIVICSLAFGLSRIGDIVDERSDRQHQAEAGVERDQAGPQTLLGPVLQRSCVEEWDVWDGEDATRKLHVEKRDFTLTAVPGHLQAEAVVSMDERYRGIFHVNTYVAKTRLLATWPALDALVPQPTQHDSRLHCGSPTLMVALTDARGIRSAQVTVDNKPVALRPGTQNGRYPLGFNVVLADMVPFLASTAAASGQAPSQAPSQAVSAQIDLELLGTGQLSFAPAAETTQVHLTSDWPHPSFGGRFLPAERQILAKGFDATWRVSALATTAPTDIQRGTPLCVGDFGMNGTNGTNGTNGEDRSRPACIESFGVAFFDPVNPYVLSDRAVKYGMLFVGLTFLAVGMVEVLQRRRVHPVQYLLVGCALSIFFLLLLSLSEHMPFAWAYAAASLACSVLLTVYASYAMGGKRAGMLFGIGVAGLYGALFVLLRREQTALAMGSLLLFAVLAGVMFATRKLDWYGVLAGGKPESVPVKKD